MTRQGIAAALAAATLAATLAAALGPAAAQVQDRPAVDQTITPKKAHRHKTAAKAPQAAPATTTARPLLGAGEDSSLERRRRAFFAKPDDGQPPEAPTPDAPITLGGSNGITPGMGFKF